jgi:predicted O-linked N-acetylglucosamine transferase (SPINDLY family)
MNLTISNFFNLALQHHQAGRLSEAEALYQQVLQASPNHPDALHNLGIIACQMGRYDVAVDYISQAIKAQPLRADFYNNLGETYRRRGQFDRALSNYRLALELSPGHEQALANIGDVLQQQGKLDEAVAQYREALAIKPDDAEAHLKLGDALQKQGKLEESVGYYRRALKLAPTNVDAFNNLGVALWAQGKQKEAVGYFQQALALKPDFAGAHNNLGNALKARGELGEAREHYQQALASNPEFAEAYYNLGIVLEEQGRLEEAVAQYRQALTLKPDYVEAENQLMWSLHCFCEWKQLGGIIEHQQQLLHTARSPFIKPFSLLCIPGTPAEQLSCARNHAAHYLAPIARLRDGLGFQFTRAGKPRLRVGYLSADFHQHATAYLIAELFELHDRAQFEIVTYSYGPNDGGLMRKRIADACDRFVEIAEAPFVEAARRIYEDKIDILIDLKGYTRGARTEILALRPAPIQVSYLGYPGTMGAECIDYIITDRFVTPPGHEPFFSEKLVYLPDCYQVNDRKREIAKLTPSRKECGLPEKGVVFCSFNNTYKITPAVFDIWMRVLQRVPGSVLWLLEANTGVAANLRREAKARGVEPERLVFAPKQPLAQHLARHRNADLFLDTWPYNAHTTASDALWAGLPVLTCAGETFASRVAGSLLTAMELPELITHSLEEYEAAAVRLARAPSELAGLKKRLAKSRLTTPLFDSERFTRHLERAYRMMWEQYLKGEGPKRIEVPSVSNV